MATRDWVLNGQTWNTQALSGGLYNPGGQLDFVGELGIFPLTFHRADPANPLEVGVPDEAHHFQSVRTMGYIHWHLAPQFQAALSTIYEVDWRATISMRIARFPMSTNGQSVGDIPGYNLVDIEPGNDQFVWHYEKHLTNQASSDWQGTSGSKAPITGSVRVDVRYRKRIEYTECMALLVQALQGSQVVGAPWTDIGGRVFLDWQAHLRTFVLA